MNSKTGNRKVQGMPQSQTAANSGHQEEEKNKKKTNTYKTNKQMREKHTDQTTKPHRIKKNTGTIAIDVANKTFRP